MMPLLLNLNDAFHDAITFEPVAKMFKMTFLLPLSRVPLLTVGPSRPDDIPLTDFIPPIPAQAAMGRPSGTSLYVQMDNIDAPERPFPYTSVHVDTLTLRPVGGPETLSILNCKKKDPLENQASDLGCMAPFMLPTPFRK
jgi:hypothetical protein